jgi:hypothetical protein
MSTEVRGLVEPGRSSENSANDNYPGLESVGKRPVYAKTVQTGRLSQPSFGREHRCPLWVKRYRSHSATLQAKSAVIQKLT